MAKQFSMGSPEYVAKFYGGDKQRILQALQTGALAAIAPPPFDQTIAVAAGAYIDRMRGAQAQEAANPPTVAQQVMGGVPPTPPVPTPPAGGLGATAPAAPPMAPMAPPMPAPEAPMGMAEGGLVGIPVPETMFDEPDNGGYAGGGLVAFSKGGMADLYDDVEYWESRGRQHAVSPKGARGVMQLMPGTMRDPGFGVTPMRADTEEENRRVGREYLDAMLARYGDKTAALMAYNWGPGNVDKWIKAGRPANRIPAETRKYVNNILGGSKDLGSLGSTVPPREADIGTAEGRMMSFEDAMAAGRSMVGDMPRAELERARGYALEELDPENQKKARKADMWQALAEMGFRMASSKSPYVLQAIGEAATATLPGVEASKKERRAAKDNAVRTLMAVEDVDRKTALAGVETGMAIYKSGMDAEQFEQGMKFKREELGAEIAMKNAELTLQRRKLNAEIEALSTTGGLSNSQATERLRMLENQYQDAVEKALEQDSENALGAVEQSLAEAGRIQSMYNAIARRTGMPPLPALNGKAFTNFNSYYKTNKATPLGTVYGAQKGASNGQQGSGGIKYLGIEGS